MLLNILNHGQETVMTSGGWVPKDPRKLVEFGGVKGLPVFSEDQRGPVLDHIVECSDPENWEYRTTWPRRKLSKLGKARHFANRLLDRGTRRVKEALAHVV